MIRVGCVGKGSSLLCDLCLALLRDPRREGGDWSLVWLKIIALPALKRERMLESQGGWAGQFQRLLRLLRLRGSQDSGSDEWLVHGAQSEVLGFQVQAAHKELFSV